MGLKGYRLIATRIVRRHIAMLPAEEERLVADIERALKRARGSREAQRERTREMNKRLYAERAACGVCVRCAGHREGQTVYCEACLDRYARYQGRTRRRARAASTDNANGGRP